MAGIAQVWLSEKELEALLLAAFSKNVQISDRLSGALRDKLLTAYEGVACPVPKSPEPAACLSCVSKILRPGDDPLEDGGPNW